jgi:MFS family permease
MAFLMFLVAVGVQFAAKRYSSRTVFSLSGIGTVFSMIFVWIALETGSAPWLIVSALSAGAGQGLGQLGGLTLIADRVPAQRRAEANAVFNMGGYVPAGAIPVLTGYLIDFWGLSIGISSLALIIASLASLALMQLLRHVPKQSQTRTHGEA